MIMIKCMCIRHINVRRYGRKGAHVTQLPGIVTVLQFWTGWKYWLMMMMNVMMMMGMRRMVIAAGRRTLVVRCGTAQITTCPRTL